MNIDKQSSLPLYVQVKDVIMKRIAAGEYAEGDRIPSERELCLSLDVSRPTVRQAVQELIAENVLMIQKGRGTYVLKQTGMVTIDGFNPLTFSFLLANSVRSKTILRLEPAQSLPGFLLAAYGVDRHDRKAQAFASRFWQVIWIESEERLPYAYCQSYIPVAMFPELKKQVDARVDSVVITANKYPLLPHRGRAELRMKLAGQEKAMLLNCTAGTPLLEQSAVMLSRSGDVTEINATLLRADLIRLRTSSDA